MRQSENKIPKVGVLALQGDFAAHQRVMATLCETSLVKKASDLDGLNGLIIPGGESSALLRLMQRELLLEKINAFYQSGGAIFGTCAGLILMAMSVTPQQRSLELLDVDVSRNAYGRQQESFLGQGEWSDALPEAQALPMAFIRAPKIMRVGQHVEVLATCRQSPVLVRDQRLLAASFHPEMSDSSVIHNYFLTQCIGL